MFSFSYKILITTVVNTISQNILTFIFGRLYSAKAVGNFSQAFKWDTMASTFVSGTISQVAQPVLVEVNNDTCRQVKVFRKMLQFTAFLVFPAMFGLSMVAHEFRQRCACSRKPVCTASQTLSVYISQHT